MLVEMIDHGNDLQQYREEDGTYGWMGWASEGDQIDEWNMPAIPDDPVSRSIHCVKIDRSTHMRADYRPVSNTIQQELDDEEVAVGEDDIPESEEAEERDGALFDSSLDYEEQLDVYQRFKRNLSDEE